MSKSEKLEKGRLDLMVEQTMSMVKGKYKKYCIFFSAKINLVQWTWWLVYAPAKIVV